MTKHSLLALTDRDGKRLHVWTSASGPCSHIVFGPFVDAQTCTLSAP